MPLFTILEKDDVLKIHEAALNLLEGVGVKIHSQKALQLMDESGAHVDFEKKLVKIPESLVIEAIKKSPSSIKLCSRNGKHDFLLRGNDFYFCPGSSAINVYDAKLRNFRKATSFDAAKLAVIVDALEYINVQCAALVVSDVPDLISDRYRYYIWLKNSTKHIMTSSFTVESPQDIIALATAIVGSRKMLSKEPYVSSIVCPSPPLQWSSLACENLMTYAKHMIPTIILPMPQINATGPASLAANVVQCLIEGLSGLVLAQLVRQGTPIIFGSDCSLLDLRTGASCTSIDSVMVCCSVAQIAKFYGLPTHTYIAESESKTLDVQVGLEAAMSTVLGALSGINLMSGPGLMTHGLAQSFEKMVIDNEICGMVYRLTRRIDVNADTIAEGLFKQHGPGGHFLAEKHTLEWFKKEQHFPSSVIDVADMSCWQSKGSKDIIQRANEKIEQILASHIPEPLPRDVEKDLDDVMRNIAKKCGIKVLPLGPSVK
jgi:trimethylamine--corrinoid protein Co-methyltransferase